MSQVVMHRIRITYETDVMDRTISEPPPAGETIEYTIESLLKPVVFAKAIEFLRTNQPGVIEE